MVVIGKFFIFFSENRKLFQIYVIVILKLNLLDILFGDRFFKLDFEFRSRKYRIKYLNKKRNHVL